MARSRRREVAGALLAVAWRRLCRQALTATTAAASVAGAVGVVAADAGDGDEDEDDSNLSSDPAPGLRNEET